MKISTLVMAMSILTTATAFAADNAPKSFTPQQETQIGKIAADYLQSHPEKAGEAMAIYLAQHPEFLLAAQENLRQSQQLAQQQAMVQMAMVRQADLLSSEDPSVGPADAKTAVVMFFDYQCAYCSKMAPVVEALIKANPNVRFVFKEFPIFASRWPASGFAARTGEKIWKEKGGKAYLAYHNALFATGHMEGKLTAADIKKIAAPYLKPEALSALEQASDNSPETAALIKVSQLAQQMKFAGTPAFVIMPQAKNPEAKRVTVLPGSTTQEVMQAAVAAASNE